MNKFKICVYAICKNEEQFVDRWMDAVSEADMVVVTDTGSTDSTVKKLRDRGAVVYEETIKPWRFDEARNRAMDHIPEAMDICVSNDLDEVFEAGWREKLETVWTTQCTRARYLFTWSYHEDGTPNKQYPMEKIHCRNGFRWVHPVHEVLSYNGELHDHTVWVPGMVLNHYPDLSKPRSQYLPLLELSAQENPDDDRGMFWLGREYMYYNEHDKSISTLMKYLEMPTALWKEERCAAMRFISKCYEKKGNQKEARSWLYKAIAECPSIREPYLNMAQLGYLENDWPLVFLMTGEALKINTKTGSYLTDPKSWDYTLYDLAAISHYRLGLYQRSYEFAQKACEIAPNDERLKNNLHLISLKLKENMG
ncbi:tetratricopeptide repeat-containing glycosyltransferase [Sinanaerobacter chloroacetimidivorans]|uniref:Glycosyl transferase family 2 n=1 Tax=Sinanaerobacter chloroacetimidivorans TaxID=2818044 RepID=A0A8J8B1G2_9FIRM|nr:glycosyl transferase family 2 [Sinanaerobacter chloroacetimidivorans]MBR0598688.1 glycosyl transferase family 2 [Sinanaerobacter chloroacetimidivorans]